MQKKNSDIFGDYPLFNRMIFYVFLFTAVSTVALTGMKMFFSYGREVEAIHHHLETLKESHLEVLVSNVWALNDEIITLQLHSILQHPDVIYLELLDTFGNQYVAGNKPTLTNLIIIKQFELNHLNRGECETIAKLKIYATIKNIQQHLLHQFPWVIGGQFIIVIFVCAFILLLFHFFFNRHLAQIVSFTKTLDLDTLDLALVLSKKPSQEGRPDELDRIVNAINDVRKRLQDGVRLKGEAEKLLRESEEKYRQIFNAPSEAIFIHDAEDGTILDVNQTMLDMYGYSREEALCLNIAELSGEDGSLAGEKALQKIKLLQKAANEGHQLFKWQDRRQNGELFWVEVALKRIVLGGKVLILAVVRDITERNRLESELRQAQKLEAVGTLAGGIAHDFNNILSAIFGYTELAQMQVKGNPKLSDNLSEVFQAAQRARDLVKQILTFSRRSDQEKQPLQVSLIVKEALKLIRSSIPATIEIKKNINSPATVLADPTQIHQIVMNLCTNAYHSMREKGGVLTVSLTEMEVAPDGQFSGLDLSPGRYLRLEVSDTGIGMDAQIRKKIFEPYFTTKGAGEGTGLGLAVVHGIVKSHNGEIHVYSEPGQGTIFNVYLPIVAEGVAASGTIVEKEKIKGGCERIMFVDDEETLTQVADEIFSIYGYRIDTFTDPVLALESFAGQPDAYSLLITDMSMPSLAGVELAQKMMVTKPDLPVILCSGFSEIMNKEKSMEIGIRQYFQKPIVMSKLVKSVREILDQEENHV